MKYNILILFFTCLSTCLFSQTNKEKDLNFKVKSEKTTVKILPDVAWIYAGGSRAITVRIKPAGRTIGKVTFKGGKITGQDSSYVITAGSGTEGILSVYEKTSAGDKLIISRVYKFRKTTLKASCTGVKNDSVIDVMTLMLGKFNALEVETKTPLKVVNFQMYVPSGEETDTLNSKGNVLTKEMKQIVGKLKDGSAIYFYNIECRMPDGVIRKIPNLRLFISEGKMWQIGM